MKFFCLFYFMFFLHDVYGEENSLSCMNALMTIKSEYHEEGNRIYLKCNEKEKSCPFSVGSYDFKSSVGAIPYNKNGTRGAMLYLGKTRKFVKFPTKNIKNDEIRILNFSINGKPFCAEYSRTFGVSMNDIYKPLRNLVSNISDYFDSPYIGYSFNFVAQDKCKDSKTAEVMDVFSNDTEDLLNGAIEREVTSLTSLTKQIDLRKEMASVLWTPTSCKSDSCLVKTKDKISEITNTLNECLKNTSDKSLQNTLKYSLEEIKNGAMSVGLMPADYQNGARTNSKPSSAVSK